MKNYRIATLVLILTPFVFSFAFGLDIYIPVIPTMTQVFETTPGMVQLTMSLFLLITGGGQLLIGPLSDQYGRKPIFYLSSLFFALGSLGCAFSGDIYSLILARAVSALGACGLLVTAFALVRDLYSSDSSAKIYSFLNGAIGISPTFAPVIGGYLAVSFGWPSVFLFLACIGALSFAVTRLFIEETHPLQNRMKMDSQVFKRYLVVFRNRQFLVYSILAGLAEGVFFCFFSVSPFILINLLEIPTEEFGFYFAVFGSVIGLGGFASGKIIEKIGIDKTIKTGIALVFIGGISMLAWHYVASLTIAGFLIPMVIACTGAMFLVGSSAAGALEPFNMIAGTAAAAFGAVEFGLSAIAGSLLMSFPVTSTVPYGISIILTGTLAFGIYFKERRRSASASLQT